MSLLTFRHDCPDDEILEYTLSYLQGCADLVEALFVWEFRGDRAEFDQEYRWRRSALDQMILIARAKLAKYGPNAQGAEAIAADRIRALLSCNLHARCSAICT